MTVIRGVVLTIGVLMLTAACADPPGQSARGTVNPSAALIGIGIVCGTVLLIVVALVVAHVSTSWRHADDDK